MSYLIRIEREHFYITKIIVFWMWFSYEGFKISVFRPEGGSMLETTTLSSKVEISMRHRVGIGIKIHKAFREKH